MRWQDMERSQNVEDRRGHSGGMMPGGKPGGVVLLLVVLVAGYFGVDLSGLLDSGNLALAPQQQTMQPSQLNPKEEQLADLTRVILKQTEMTWQNFFNQIGKRYDPPVLVLYRNATETACGYGQAAMGPFYCPADRKLYIDLAFYDDMQRKLGGGGDFALGYVVAHEVGHHVQNLTGVSQQVRQLQRGQSERTVNQLSVLLELQADCYAGIWGHQVRKSGRMEYGDLEEALDTATAIGDDRLQRRSQGRVIPDSFTHGTSEQRYYWFKRGFDSGNPALCSTFDKK